MSAKIEVQHEDANDDEIEDVEEDVKEEDKEPEEPVKEEVKEEVKEPVEAPAYQSKVVKKLTKDERQMLIDKFNNGEEDAYFKVVKMSNGSIRITKRKTPVIQDAEQAQKEHSNTIERKGRTSGRLTNEQLLMEHIIDLEKRFECMRLKHKKLKKRYNELENSIYEDVDDIQTPVQTAYEAVEEHAEEPVETHEEAPAEPVPEQPTTSTFSRQRRAKRSWRDAINYM